MRGLAGPAPEERPARGPSAQTARKSRKRARRAADGAGSVFDDEQAKARYLAPRAAARLYAVAIGAQFAVFMGLVDVEPRIEVARRTGFLQIGSDQSPVAKKQQQPRAAVRTAAGDRRHGDAIAHLALGHARRGGRQGIDGHHALAGGAGHRDDTPPEMPFDPHLRYLAVAELLGNPLPHRQRIVRRHRWPHRGHRPAHHIGIDRNRSGPGRQQAGEKGGKGGHGWRAGWLFRR